MTSEAESVVPGEVSPGEIHGELCNYLSTEKCLRNTVLIHFVFYFSNSVKCPCNVIHDSVTLIFTLLIIIIIIIINIEVSFMVPRLHR